ncbi:3-(3-hydroxy-phenyl)propionate transporter MhpT [Burkholderia vietnamiensis]|uniref:3-(3-hydroxy-phenyl)propionate transporter MhpT n=1 Tax=Burkholderia vietnamiensis TaxID=60552 RepID=UPI001CF568AF|nr:3-(3-hydroxy-phenyl)propionate transporter MhpT [Burkholderia vietnamiensis]MCA8015538.1 3-(3-hydroxy-phenyl)propionate transporter MhpT [Burkholderia vietnamiensis]MDN7553942.1 3-(3-hydroxy-phenyl)propionate transporter MhpT [Burkholderia vietnamiensis]HDR8937155.1 3-(3-hydroxy-phenyl)propionate transporter MhpT [Burkholderia vietnamiensis]HDR9091251.1 3-(3-hydroxy-phenyl)propionate transporter MhpT [Burkholderia vietnamiensis]HDR9260641.1 3-(3-hydroxy-phenyl)propionate transporter MhpT [B
MNTSTASPPRVGGAITIGLCLAVALLEGLDLQSTGIAAPRMAREFHLAVAQLGWAFGIGALGLLPGAALGGRLADRIGRKRVLMMSVALFGIFSIATTQVWDLQSLLVARFLTGLGLGAAMPNLIALCAEAAPPRQRSTAVGAMYCGMPFGAALAAVIGIVSPGAEGWRQIFYVGGIGPLLTLPLLALCLKESTQFAAASQGASRASKDGIVRALFSDGRAGTTIALWISYLGTLIVLYFLMNWLPSMVLSRGLTPVQASVVQMMFNIGGGIGAIVIAALSDRIGKRPVVVGMYAGIALALLALAGATGSVSMAWGGLLAGLFLVGTQSVLYALAGATYPTRVRGTGVGAAVAVGRMGSMIGPLIAGQLLALGQSASLLVISSIPLIVIAALGALTAVAKSPRESVNGSHTLGTESI